MGGLAFSLPVSELLQTEVIRAVRRFDPGSLVAAKDLLHTVNLLAVHSSTFARAAELDPRILRTLDALHLASALELADELDVLLTYDDRLSGACALHGVAVLAPAADARRVGRRWAKMTYGRRRNDT